MLDMVTSGSSAYNNAARIASSGLLRKGKILCASSERVK